MSHQEAQTQASRQKSGGARLLEFLGSMNLAITLLLVVAIASVIGTVLQQNQAFQDYQIKFGPFWFQVFDALGLYDVYTAGWFMALLSFMVLSTSVCIYRNLPHVLNDMRQFREHARAKSLRSFHHKREWIAGSSDDLLEAAGRVLKVKGYQWKGLEAGDHRMLAAKKGGIGRLGYLLTHGAIVLICIGGLIDGNVTLKFREWTGNLKPETRNLVASEIPEISRLSVDNPSFRASITIPEKRVSRVAFLTLREGFLVQPLPFSIEVKDFRIEHYETGQPKSFESDLVVRDLENPERSVEQTIKVNHPMVFDGYTIYQSSFGDGGSRLQLKAWPLMSGGGAVSFEGEVDTAMALPAAADEPLTLELLDFTPINVRPLEEPEGGKTQRNFGPSFNFKLRDPAGQAVEYTNFMLPVKQQGRMVYLTGMRREVSEPFRYLHIPADPKGGLERFMRYRSMLLDAAVIEAASATAVEQMVGKASEMEPEVLQRMRSAMRMVLRAFAIGGFDGVMQQLEATVPEERREEVGAIYQRSLEHMLSLLYLETLKAEGVDVSSGLGETDGRFFDDAVTALGALPLYGAPHYLQLTGFDHIQATGLQIARTPGKTLVYLGCVMLVVGIFFMFYLPHKRLWLRMEPQEGGVAVLFAGSTPRNAYDFTREFEAIAGYLEQQTSKS
jgi:cytochrome c biogenesis protein